MFHPFKKNLPLNFWINNKRMLKQYQEIMKVLFKVLNLIILWRTIDKQI